MDIQETRIFIFKRDRWRCCICHEYVGKYSTPQCGHIIPAKKHYIAKYGKEVIHHHLNMKATCCLAHNAKIDINGKVVLIEKLVKKIKKELESLDKCVQ